MTTGYSLEADFNIDKGQLLDEPPERVFAFGVEFGMAYADWKNGKPFEMVVHAANADRISSFLKAKGLDVATVGYHDDWTQIIARRTA